MNTVEIDITTPDHENLVVVTIEDQYDKDHIHVDFAEIDAARVQGPQQLLETILNYAGGNAIDILRAALQNGSPVNLEGQEISSDIIENAVSSPSP